MLVLNASYEPLNVCTVRRAVVLVLKEKAELVEKSERAVRSESVTLPHPVVIRLVSYVRIPRDQRRRRITRRAVFARDSWTCQYCGTTSHLTVDHVIPRSRGGPSDWDNIVTSCAPCNRRKGNRTPVESGMHARRKPRAPGPDDLHPRRRAGRSDGLAAVPDLVTASESRGSARTADAGSCVRRCSPGPRARRLGRSNSSSR